MKATAGQHKTGWQKYSMMKINRSLADLLPAGEATEALLRCSDEGQRLYTNTVL